MPRKRQGIVAGLVIALCALAVLLQLEPWVDAGAVPVRRLAIGERLELDLRLEEVSDPPRLRNPLDGLGRTATVLYTWSVPCPCIEALEERLVAVSRRFGPPAGVAWMALAGEPGDDAAALREKRERVGAFYPVLRDPEQQVCRRIGLVHAAMVVVLDGEGRLVYRGAVDDDYADGEAQFLAEALAALVAGAPVPVPERPWEYGCEFAVPESCLEYGDVPPAPPGG